MSTGAASGPDQGPFGRRPDLSVLQDEARIAAVERLISVGPGGERLDRLVAMAARILQSTCAQVSVLGARDQVIAAVHGIDVPLTQRRAPIEDSLCTVTAASGHPLVVEDAAQHPWVKDLPPVVDGSVGAYLGVVLTDAAGHTLGSLCVYDEKPRSWSPKDVADLTALASAVILELEQHANSAQSEAARLRLELAAGAADLGSYDYDLRDGALVWDERMLAMHDVTAEDFGGRLTSFEALVHPEDLPGVAQAMAHAIEVVGELIVEYRIVLADGGSRWIKARGRVLPDMLGAPARILGAAYDSSAERDLRDELTRLLESMPAAFLRCDRQWSITYVNAVAEGLYGRARQELVGQQLWEAFPEVRGTTFEAEYRRAMETREPGVVEAYFAPLDTHFEVRVWPDEQGLSLFFHDMSETRRAFLALEQANDRLSALSAAGALLSASLQPPEVLGVLSDLIVPNLASWLVLAVVSDVAELLGIAGAGAHGTRLHPVHLRHMDRAHEEVLRQVTAEQVLLTTGESGVGKAVRTGRVESLPRVPDEVLEARSGSAEDLARMWVLNTGPVLSVPLRSPSGVLGAFTVGGADERPLDELLLVDLAARAAVALDNALAFARQNRAATVLQRALLPREAAAVPDVQVATRYLPASTGALAGGDFFKTVRVDGRLVTMLGDVMGHGTESAARAGQLHSLVAALALEGHGPGALLERLAAGVDQMMDLELATLVVCSYDPATRRLTTATAGHPPPLFAPVQGKPYYLDLEPGAPIGVLASSYPEHTCDLEPGSTTVLFSDGLVERRGESLTDGLERLRQAVNELRLPPEAVADHILTTLGRTGGGDDDVALLVLSHL